MKILFVASYYPPYAPMSGTRIGKLTSYFHKRGHDVRVLGAANDSLPALLQPGVPEERVTYVPVRHRPGLASRLLRRLRRRKKASGGGEAASSSEQPPRPQSPGRLERAKAVYRQLRQIPDSYTSWRAPAVEAGLAMIAKARPDVIYASVPLHSGFLVAAELARRSGVPLVVEYRDLWVDHPYYDAPGWRRGIERRMERRAARQVTAYVTVTDGWRSLLEAQRGVPTELVLNGFDPDDFHGADMHRRFAPDDVLTIFYAGALYGDKRDPTPLFEALRRMGEGARSIRVLFHTSDRQEIDEKVRAFGLQGVVESKGPVPQNEILAIEQAADILLLLRWDHPSEEAVLAGKLFEYIGAGRPILSVGLETGEAADLIRENGFGIVSKDPEIIAAQLRQWLRMQRDGGVPAPAPDKAARFSRSHQFEKLETFLGRVLA